jgi:uncharacterized membrane protein YfcA
MSLEPWQWALAFGFSFLIGLSKTGISGLGLFAIIAFAIILPARESVGVVLPILLAGDMVAIAVYRRDAHWGHLLRLFPWAGLGIVLGAIAAGQLPAVLMRVIIGVIVIALTIIQAIRSQRPAEASAPPPPTWLSPAAGLLAGMTTMIANAGGPLTTIYLLAMRLPKLTFVGTAVWFFMVLNLFKVPFSIYLGLITPASAALSLRLAPFAVIGALFGRRLIRDMKQHLFDQIALALTLVAGIRLLIG